MNVRKKTQTICISRKNGAILLMQNKLPAKVYLILSHNRRAIKPKFDLLMFAPKVVSLRPFNSLSGKMLTHIIHHVIVKWQQDPPNTYIGARTEDGGGNDVRYK